MEKLIKMATIIGLEEIHDPDETYELTADNVKKMLAIYMRFRSRDVEDLHENSTQSNYFIFKDFFINSQIMALVVMYAA